MNIAELPAVHEDLVRIAKQFYDEVLSGRFVGFAAVAIQPGNDVVVYYTGPTVNITTTIGAVARLQADLIRSIDGK